MSFSKNHASTMIKYIGISFITGAIAHGFFSGSRQIATALFGIVCFIIGTYMEEGGDKNMKVIATSAMLAIGIGAVTGGLQHFPDSPERSVWILPVGFVASLAFFALVHREKISKKYALVSTLFITTLSVVLYLAIENGAFGSTHSHSETETIAPTIIAPTETNTHEDAPHGHE